MTPQPGEKAQMRKEDGMDRKYTFRGLGIAVIAGVATLRSGSAAAVVDPVKSLVRAPAIFVSLLAALLLPETAPAAPGWKSLGLGGRAISSLVVDPSSPSRIYAAAGVDGIYRSSDGNENWTRVDIGQPVEKLAINGTEPGKLYAIAGARFQQDLLRSLDQGRTWAKIKLAEPVTSVVFDPNEARVLHAGHMNATVSTSRDGGATWSWSQFQFYCSGWCYEAITSLALDPSSPSTMYAGIDADFDYPGFAELFKTIDGGGTWKQSDAGLVLWSSVYAVAVDPDNSQRVFTGTSAGTYLSLDGAQTWARTSASHSRAFAVDPWNPLVLYAGTDSDGVLRSTDRGAHWSAFDSGLANPRILSLAIDRARGLLLAGTSDGVYGYPIADPRDVFLDLFDGGGGATGFLMVEAFGGFRQGTADESGRKALGPAYGPYAGWMPRGAASDGEGGTRVLWTNDDGAASLWLTRLEGAEVAFSYPPTSGWEATDVGAGPEGSTRLLWTADDGAISLWAVDRSGVRTSVFEYGPYAGWSAAAIAGGPDGRTRILWNNTDGRAGVSFAGSGGSLETTRYASENGWSFVDLDVAGDNHTRLLRSHEDGRIAVWRIDESGTPASLGTIYAAPAGFRAARLSAGSDVLTRVLWRNSDGLALVWLMTPDGEYQASFPLN
jgi:photosystem II stability/assembly factor-like uncharacterized protein